MRRLCISIVAIVAVLFSPGGTFACLWDYDTLLMERRKFPGVVELISGKFLRHSPEFYEWRIRDRTEKLKNDPNRLDWYDDLAVAYSKTGNHKKAIEIIQQKDKLKPGLYETEANWGTFLLFDGQWEEALKHVNRALEINPNAHFGREKYQALLIEYVIPRLNDGKPQLPLSSVVLPVTERRWDGTEKTEENGEEFDSFLERKLEKSYHRRDAVTAVLGMMHFADYQMPILLESLGSLMADERGAGELQLAARAFIQAARGVDDPRVAERYRQKAESILQLQVGVSLPRVQAELMHEVQEADAWYASLRQAELSWIRDGKDADAEFLRRYPVEPEIAIPLKDRAKEILGVDSLEGRLLWGLGAFLGATIFVIVLFVRWLGRRARSAEI
jgi:tetratricopeptide (TPR) repeat protein